MSSRGGTRDTQHKGFFHKNNFNSNKVQAALALAVSLWIGGAGVAIRGADISGTSLRGEIGATFRPGEKSNVTLDLNLSGFAGKKRGLTGGISAVFHI